MKSYFSQTPSSIGQNYLYATIIYYCVSVWLHSKSCGIAYTGITFVESCYVNLQWLLKPSQFGKSAELGCKPWKFPRNIRRYTKRIIY